MRRIRFASLAVLLSLASCVATPPASLTAPGESLAESMAQRLEISHEVAWIKYRDALPVRDAKREAEVVDRMGALAAARGMDAAAVRTFFAAQIAASCAEQSDLIRKWKHGAPLPVYAPRNLRTAVRHDIDAINLALLEELAKIAPDPGLKSAIARTLRRRGFPRQVAGLAAKGL